MLLQIKTSKVCARTEGRSSSYFWAGSCYTFFLAWHEWLFGQISSNVLQLVRWGMPFNRKFLSSMWSATLSQVSNKAASSADKEKLLKEYFHRGYLYAAIVTLLEKLHGVRIPVRMRKRKLKIRPRKVRPVRRCSLSTFTLITCRSFIILNFIYARKASQIQVRKLCKI